jgi:hypothetical protein
VRVLVRVGVLPVVWLLVVLHVLLLVVGLLLLVVVGLRVVHGRAGACEAQHGVGVPAALMEHVLLLLMVVLHVLLLLLWLLLKVVRKVVLHLMVVVHLVGRVRLQVLLVHRHAEVVRRRGRRRSRRRGWAPERLASVLLR